MSDSFPSMQVGNASSASFASGTEQDLIIFNDGKTLQKSILSLYFNISLGGASQVELRYYAAFVTKPISGTGAYVSGDWYIFPAKTVSSTASLITDNYVSVTSTNTFVDSVATSNNTTIYPALAAFKVTVKAITNISSTVSVVAMVRDN